MELDRKRQEELNKSIGETLKEFIEAHGYNYTTFAEAVGFKQGYISKIVNGNAPKIPVPTILEFCKIFKISLVEFFAAVEKKTLQLTWNSQKNN